ncbi:MAG: hypothetical protein QOJ29_3386 [Thermoleophilaceae bacterium]|jgi:alcohol dehydrogenase class IV|nr:hypothetical protein [Thermoleophilaceae bacterium]
MAVDPLEVPVISLLAAALDRETPTRPFVAPSRLVSGRGSRSLIAAELLAVGAVPDAGCVPVVADANIIALGLEADVMASLEAAGFEPRLLGGVAGEPTPATVAALLDEIGEESVGAVVGIGGGSAMDTAKIIAAATANQLELTVGLAATTKLNPPPVVALMPTTVGTGAEATAVAMLWHDGVKRIFVHPYLVARVALLDSELIAELPPAVIASSGLDAVSHAVESLLSTFATPMTTVHASAALETLSRSLLPAYERQSEAALAAMLFGSYQAGLALNASVVVGHSLAYTIAARAGLSHGVTCAMALPYCLAYCRPGAEPQMRLAAAVTGAGTDAHDLLVWTLALNEALEIPASLGAVGISEADLDAMALECVETYPRPNNPVPLNGASIARLLARFHDGDAEAAWQEAGPE